MSEKVLPTFLGIGAQKSWTTRLHDILSKHPEVYVPQLRKELHFFDKEENYNQWIEWYQWFFTDNEDSKDYKQIWEITPRYIFTDNAPSRIQETFGEKANDLKFIVILRNPVDSVFSNYKHWKQLWSVKENFESFIKDNQSAFERWLYSQQLQNYFNHFPRENFLILFFEEVINNKDLLQEKLSNFLEISKDKFDTQVLNQKSNSSKKPVLHKPYAFLLKQGKKLRKKWFDRTVNFIKGLGIHNWFLIWKKEEKLDQGTRKKVYQMYQQEIEKLENLLDKDLSFWKL